MATRGAAIARSRGPSRARLAVALVAGALVAVSLGVYGRVHDPTGRSLVTVFFKSTLTLKVWLATGAIILAVVQVLTALRMYGRLGRRTGPAWIRPVHRFSGTAAFLLTIPVAYHCLWALGLQDLAGSRVLIHGIFGCLFFGALFSKVLIVEVRRTPRWALPLLGGVVFTALVVVWSTSALWYFRTVGVHL